MIRRLNWMLWVLVAIWCLSCLPAAVRPAPKNYPPPPWVRRYAAADLIRAVPVLRRAEEFMLQTRHGLPVYPAAWEFEDRVEIILQTWTKSRTIWNDPRSRRAYDSPNGPFFHLLGQQAAESEFDRNARSPANADGSRDLGLTQQNSRYLRQRGITDWRNIEQQTQAQALFMNYLLQQASRFGGGQARQAASAGYTAGPRWAGRGVVPDIGRTQAHVARIEQFYQEMLGSEKPSPPAPARPGVKTYIVRQDDTLWWIAQGHGTTVTRLAERNSIENPDLIQVGQSLVLS